VPNNYTTVNCNAPSLSYQTKTPLQPVPTANTQFPLVNVDLLGLSVSNPTASAITFIMTDGQSTPQTFINTSIPANQTYVVNAPYGVFLEGGFWCIAGGVGLIFGARWCQ
jgi:hypothetical protein